MTCAPNEDLDQPGHTPSLIRVFSIFMKKRCYPLSAQQRLRSDWADAQNDDLILRRAHMSFCWFCHAAAQIMSSRCRGSNLVVFTNSVAEVVFTPCGLRLLSSIRPAPIAQLVECPFRGTGGHGFDPGPRHTKVVKHSTSCSSLGTQTYGVELGLVDPVSG